jgi:hypothetical protein
MEIDLQSLFGLHVLSCTHCLRSRIPPSPRVWAHVRGRCWSPKIDDITFLCDPLVNITVATKTKKIAYLRRERKHINIFLRVLRFVLRNSFSQHRTTVILFFLLFPVTGHADGSVRFWDASSSCMQALCRLRTQKLFEKVCNRPISCLFPDSDPSYGLPGSSGSCHQQAKLRKTLISAVL